MVWIGTVVLSYGAIVNYVINSAIVSGIRQSYCVIAERPSRGGTGLGPETREPRGGGVMPCFLFWNVLPRKTRIFVSEVSSWCSFETFTDFLQFNTLGRVLPVTCL